MTKRQLTIAFFIFVLFYFWWQGDENELSSPQKATPPFSSPKAVTATAKPSESVDRTVTPPTATTLTPSNSERRLKSPEKQRSLKTTASQKSPEAVPFKTYKGMAIAYGDVLLGTVSEDVKEGYTSPPEIGYWPSATIPYHIQPNVSNPDRILRALAYLSNKTVLEFIPYEEGMNDAIVFETTDQHCFSYVGRISGTQPIYISNSCDWFHIVHEVLHAMGLVHEHSRPDRDQFISILWDNIPVPYRSQFEIMPDNFVKDWLRYDYDVYSIMHYGSQIFTADHKAVSLIRKDGVSIPEPHELSPMDIQKINDLFQGR